MIDIGNGYHLNPVLVEQQNLTSSQIKRIVRLHAKRWKLFVDSITMKPTVVVQRLEKLEYALQRAWGFIEDSDRHTHWYTVPGCSCSIGHNNQLFGDTRRNINETCKYHGGNN